MYSFKEKKKHLEELSNKDAAEADLLLLKQAQPTHHSLHTFERNPKRYAQDILYALLDYRSRDEIRMHRREIMNQEKQDDIPSVAEETTDAAKESAETKKDSSEAETSEAEETVSKTEMEEVKNQLQEAEERAEVAEEEKESLQEELENEQSAREQAEQALAEEKKKEPKKKKALLAKPKASAKSKSMKNTRK